MRAARLLLDGGFPTQAISRAYYAAFYAGKAALDVIAQSSSTHAGLITAFGQGVVLEGGFDRQLGKVLASLFGQRSEADYEGLDAQPDEAAGAIADAERFVEAVEAWIAAREPAT